MSRKKKTVKAEEKQTKNQTAKKPIVGKTTTGKNTGSGAGKTATDNKSSSRRAQQPAKGTKKTPAKQEQSKPKQQPKEQRVLVHGVVAVDENGKPVFPNKFPFWARLKISKNRTTLVIDETQITDKKTKKPEEAFVHREATHRKKKGLEEIKPNPDKTDKDPMYLKSPSKLPKRLFKPHNKELDVPEHLRERYDKNNKKGQ